LFYVHRNQIVHSCGRSLLNEMKALDACDRGREVAQRCADGINAIVKDKDIILSELKLYSSKCEEAIE
jgi:hypothetical protein